MKKYVLLIMLLSLLACNKNPVETQVDKSIVGFNEEHQYFTIRFSGFLDQAEIERRCYMLRDLVIEKYNKEWYEIDCGKSIIYALDVEFISELTIAFLNGHQNKKTKLDKYYEIYEQEFDEEELVEDTFNEVLPELLKVLPGSSKSRWRKKTDFYTLFLLFADNSECLPMSRAGRELAKNKLSEFEDMVKTESSTVNTSASGRVEVISYGKVNYMMANIKYATDIVNQGVIRNNANGVADLRNFMNYIINKYPIEFLPDIDDPNNFTTCILESTALEKKGTAFQLYELYGQGLANYWETKELTFRQTQ